MKHDLSCVRIDETLRAARAARASDVHLIPDSPPALRVDGRITHLAAAALSRIELDALVGEMLGTDERDRLHAEGDVSLAIHSPAYGAMRAHAYEAAGGVRIAVRLLAAEPPSMEELQLPRAVAELADVRRGLVIFTGPTGSGKSTSLAALIDHMNRFSARHIVTIEDPIEFLHMPARSIVSQREVGRDCAGFDEAIVGALRADPDVILLGEMRTAAAIRAALVAAETGHVVYATLHTGDAVQTMSRMVDAFTPDHQPAIRAQLAQVLTAVVAQRLVARVGGGRRCAMEVLLATDAVRSIVRDGKVHQLRNVIATGRAAGMQTLEEHLSMMVAAGDIALDEARSATDRPDEIPSFDGMNG